MTIEVLTRGKYMGTKKSDVRIGVAAILYSKKQSGAILLGKRKGSHGAGTWSLPGGKMEYGEHPEETAIREIREETGLIVSMVMPYLQHPYNSVVMEDHWVTLVFVGVHEIEDEPRVMEPNKCEEWRWFSKQCLPYPLFLPFANLAEDMRWI